MESDTESDDIDNMDTDNLNKNHVHDQSICGTFMFIWKE